MAFCKANIVIFATLSQPSSVVGNLGGIGRGWPNTIQNRNENAARAPVIAPPSVADSVPMPRVKTPNSGPPTTPKIVREACGEKNSFYPSSRARGLNNRALPEVTRPGIAL